jgi:hypothetical protein
LLENSQKAQNNWKKQKKSQKKFEIFIFWEFLGVIFFGKHWNPIFDQKNSKYQKAVSRFTSRHHSSFNLVVLSTKSDDFYFRFFTSGLLKCDFLELSKNFSNYVSDKKLGPNFSVFYQIYTAFWNLTSDPYSFEKRKPWN